MRKTRKINKKTFSRFLRRTFTRIKICQTQKNEENKSPTDFLRKKCKDERDLLTSVYQSRKKHLLKRNYKTDRCSMIKIDLINVLTRRRKYLYFHNFNLQAKPKIIIELLLLWMSFDLLKVQKWRFRHVYFLQDLSFLQK